MADNFTVVDDHDDAMRKMMLDMREAMINMKEKMLDMREEMTNMKREIAKLNEEITKMKHETDDSKDHEERLKKLESIPTVALANVEWNWKGYSIIKNGVHYDVVT